MTDKAGWLYDTGRDAGEASNMAKLAAADAAGSALDQAIQTHGGNGMATEYGLATLWGMARLLRIAPGQPGDDPQLRRPAHAWGFPGRIDRLRADSRRPGRSLTPLDGSAAAIMVTVRNLSREARLGLALTSAASFAFLIALGLELHSRRGPVSVNERANRLVFKHLFGVPVVPLRAAHAYQQVGQPVPFAILVSVIVVGLLWRRDLPDALVAALGAPIAVLLADDVFKPVFDRIRSRNVTEFPSGHTTAMTVLAVLLLLVAYRWWGRRGVVIALPVAVWVSGSMIVSVIRLQQHVLTDAVGGVLLGVGPSPPWLRPSPASPHGRRRAGAASAGSAQPTRRARFLGGHLQRQRDRIRLRMGHVDLYELTGRALVRHHRPAGIGGRQGGTEESGVVEGRVVVRSPAAARLHAEMLGACTPNRASRKRSCEVWSKGSEQT